MLPRAIGLAKETGRLCATTRSLSALQRSPESLSEPIWTGGREVGNFSRWKEAGLNRLIFHSSSATPRFQQIFHLDRRVELTEASECTRQVGVNSEGDMRNIITLAVCAIVLGTGVLKYPSICHRLYIGFVQC